MFRLQSKITINKTVFTSVNSVEILSSWENLTDTATIRISNNFKRNGENITVGDNGFFKRGDEVLIELGYHETGGVKTVFEGFVRRIFLDNLIIIECEDLSFKLKQEPVTISTKAQKLNELIQQITNVNFQAVDANVGKYRISNSTALKVLEDLKNIYGLTSYIRNKVLRVGLAYYPEEANEINFDLEKNIIENNLEFIDSNELGIVVKGISTQKNNTVLSRWAYYDNENNLILTGTDPKKGETDTLNVPEQTEEEIDNYIIQRLKKRTGTGVKGSFVSFLEPQAKHGDVVNLSSLKFPEKAGFYYIKKVVTKFGVDTGGRQEIELDLKRWIYAKR